MNDKTITVYNRHKDEEKKDRWIRTVIHGVEYHYSADRSVNQSGAIVFTQLLTVIIPDEAGDKEYISASEYEKLSIDEAEKYYTLNPGNNLDVIVAGECEKEITTSYKVSDLRKEYQKSGTIASLTDNTEGDMLKHYKVVCK